METYLEIRIVVAEVLKSHKKLYEDQLIKEVLWYTNLPAITKKQEALISEVVEELAAQGVITISPKRILFHVDPGTKKSTRNRKYSLKPRV